MKMCWACCPVPGPFNGRLVDGARVSQGQRRAENLVHNDRPAQVRDGRVPDGVEFVDGLRLVVLRSLVQSGDEVFIRRPRLDVPFFHAFFRAAVLRLTDTSRVLLVAVRFREVGSR